MEYAYSPLLFDYCTKLCLYAFLVFIGVVSIIVVVAFLKSIDALVGEIRQLHEAKHAQNEEIRHLKGGCSSVMEF